MKVLIIFTNLFLNKIFINGQMRGSEFCDKTVYPNLNVNLNGGQKSKVTFPWIASIMSPLERKSKRRLIIKQILSEFGQDIVSIQGLLTRSKKYNETIFLIFTINLWIEKNHINSISVLSPVHEDYMYKHRCLSIIVANEWIVSPYIPFKCRITASNHDEFRVIATVQKKDIQLRRVIEVHERCRKSYDQEDEDGPECSTNYDHEKNTWNYTEDYPGIVLYRIEPQFIFKYYSSILPICLNKDETFEKWSVLGYGKYYSIHFGQLIIDKNKRNCITKKKYQQNTICTKKKSKQLCDFIESGSPLIELDKDGNVILVGIFISRGDKFSCYRLEFIEIKKFHDWIVDTASRQESCGKSYYKSGVDDDRYIAKGSDAKVGQFPWLVSLHRDVLIFKERRCMGSIVDWKWVLTSKHCLHGFEPSFPINEFYKLSIYAGGIDIENYKEVYFVHQLRTMDPLEIPCKEHFHCHNTAADLALIKIQGTFDNIQGKYKNQRICLPFIGSGNIYTKGTLGLIAGHGRTINGYTSILQWDKIIVNDCRSYLKDTMCSKNSLTDRENFKGSPLCVGDLGTPLMVYRESTEQWYAVSILHDQIPKMRECGDENVRSRFYIVKNFKRFIYWSLQY